MHFSGTYEPYLGISVYLMFEYLSMTEYHLLNMYCVKLLFMHL